MGALPKKQLSKSKQKSRASHYKFSLPSKSVCSQCNTVKLPHQVCPDCGYYQGKPTAVRSDNVDESST